MSNLQSIVSDYDRNYNILVRAHYLAADKFSSRNRWLGIPVVVITAVVGTTIFGTLNENPDPSFKIATGLFSLIGTIFSALQTTFGFGQIADRHKTTAARYSAFRRKLKIYKLNYIDQNINTAEAITELEKLHDYLEQLSLDGPSIPDQCYDQAKREYNTEKSSTEHQKPAQHE